MYLGLVLLMWFLKKERFFYGFKVRFEDIIFFLGK